MNNTGKRTDDNMQKQKMIPTVSAVFNDGTILEMVYQPTEKRFAFVLWRNGEWKIENGFSVSPFHRWVPYSPNNNLIRNEVVLLPSEPQEYGSEELLLGEIQSFIHCYVDVSPFVRKDRQLLCAF
jgi:hypothetical protein